MDPIECGTNLAIAYEAARPGAELELEDGVYARDGAAVLTIAKNITIRSKNRGAVILNGQGAHQVLRIVSGTVFLDGLSITNGTATVSEKGAGLSIEGGTVDVRFCTIENNMNTLDWYAGGVYVEGEEGQQATVASFNSCSILHNKGRQSGGFYLWYSTVEMRSVTIRGNVGSSEAGGGGIGVFGGYLSIYNSVISDNVAVSVTLMSTHSNTSMLAPIMARC